MRRLLFLISALALVVSGFGAVAVAQGGEDAADYTMGVPAAAALSDSQACGENGEGLRNAYCETLDCEGDTPTNAQACDRIRSNYESKTGLAMNCNRGPVRILWGGFADDLEGFQEELDGHLGAGFTEVVGELWPEQIPEWLEAGDADAAVVYRVSGLVQEDLIHDMEVLVDIDAERSLYPEGLLDGYSEDGAVYGAPVEVYLKSLVFYDPVEFAAAGYSVPETWDELIALSDQIVADGGTPWCMDMYSGPHTGWMGTDFVEDILVRTAGLDFYQKWTNHEVPFTDLAVREAFELYGELLFTPGYTYDLDTVTGRGPDYDGDGIADCLWDGADNDSDGFVDELDECESELDSYWGAMLPMIGINDDYDPAPNDLLNFDELLAIDEDPVDGIDNDGDGLVDEDPDDPPQCWMHHQSSDGRFSPGPATRSAFWFPTIDGQGGAVGGGLAFASANARPEVCQVAQLIFSGDWGAEGWQADGHITPHQQSDLSNYTDEFTRALAEQVASAAVFAFDGSDLMPHPVGTFEFWGGIVEWIGGAIDLDDVLQNLEESWVCVETYGPGAWDWINNVCS